MATSDTGGVPVPWAHPVVSAEELVEGVEEGVGRGALGLDAGERKVAIVP